jgi:DNA polymerase III epsilon subunit-like protein
MVLQMKLPNLSLIVLDTETTGFVPKIHHVIEYACAVIEKGKLKEEYEQLLALPEDSEIPQAVQVLTRIKPNDLVDQPTFEKSLPVMQALLSDDAVIVGQNVKFDLGMLKGEGWDLTNRAWIDTSMLASLVFPDIESYSLGYISTVLKLNHDPPHRALGDVRATLSLLEKCWERLSELTPKQVETIKEFAKRGPEGYRRFFESLEGKGKKSPAWLKTKKETFSLPKAMSVTPPAQGKVKLVEEPLDPDFVPSVLAGLSGSSWIAVKNIEAAADRFPASKDYTLLYPPEFILSTEAKEKFLAQDQFAGDELTLAMKLSLYDAEVRSDLPLHGDEYSIFTGKLACTKDSKDYKTLRSKADSSPAILSHQHLLDCSNSSDNPLPKKLSLYIDDASMLEDTATAAFAWTCHLPSLRAASQGDSMLTKCVDLIELWAERVRADMDLRYLAPSDLESKDSGDLARTVEKILDGELPPQIRQPLKHLLLILDDKNLPGRITWIESMQDQSKIIKSVPEDIASLLQKSLYSAAPTTLFIPPASADDLQPILPDAVQSGIENPDVLPDSGLTIKMPIGINLEMVFKKPEGKTIVLVSSKRTIEDIYVKHAERLEAEGVGFVCQGFNGGQGRMRAEFQKCASPAFLVMTPWTYELVELPAESVDRLILQVLPFDHPSHPVVGRRAGRFRDPFSDYSLPRLKNRLFRLLRTFRRHAKPGSTVDFLDDRLRTKPYGREVTAYLLSLGSKKVQQSTQLSFL